MLQRYWSITHFLTKSYNDYIIGLLSCEVCDNFLKVIFLYFKIDDLSMLILPGITVHISIFMHMYFNAG